MIKYRIVVGGAGKVYDGESWVDARHRFKQFVALSKKRRSKANPRSITLFKDYEIVRQYLVPDPELEAD